MGGTPLGSPIIGWIAQHLGARWSLVIGGTLTILGVLLALAVYARLRGGMRNVLTPVDRTGSLFPRVWDNQAVARARKQSGDQIPGSGTDVTVSRTFTGTH
jgi:MFS family permease